MSDLSQSLKKNRLVENGEPVKGTITDITGAALFNTGWIESEFMYETPTIFITCETSFGTIQLEKSFRSFSDSGLRAFLNQSSEVSPSDVDFESLLNEDIYLAFGPERTFVTIGADHTISYNKQSKLASRSGSRVRDLDEMFEDDSLTTGYEKRSLEYLNNIVELNYTRENNSNYGWVPATFSYEGVSDGEHTFKASVGGFTAYWRFTDSFDKLDKIEEFLSLLGIEYTPAEFDTTETIWMKPLADAHYSNRPGVEDTIFDDSEYWIASKKPLKQEKEKSLFGKIKSFLSLPSSTTVSVSTNPSSGMNRRALCSDNYNDTKRNTKQKELETA